MVDKIKQIKKSRLKSEEIWFLELITDLEEVKSEKYSDVIFWKKNGKKIFEQNIDSNILWIDYYNVWMVFKNRYNYYESDMKLFVKNMVGEHLNWKCFNVFIWNISRQI